MEQLIFFALFTRAAFIANITALLYSFAVICEGNSSSGVHKFHLNSKMCFCLLLPLLDVYSSVCRMIHVRGFDAGGLFFFFFFFNIPQDVPFLKLLLRQSCEDK